MATIRFEKFGGIIPKIHPTLLSGNGAVVAHNCRLKSGKLVPFKIPKLITDIPVKMCGNLTDIKNARKLYLWHRSDMSKQFLAWESDGIDVAVGNIANDKLSRLFVTGHTGIGENGTDPIAIIEQADSGETIFHSIKKEQLEKPLVVLLQGGNADTNKTRYTYFVQTWVDEYGYESGASVVGELLTGKYTRIKTINPDTTESVHWYNYGDNDILEDAPSVEGLTIIEEIVYEEDGLNKIRTSYAEETGYNDDDEIIVKAATTPVGFSLDCSRRIYKVIAGSESDNIQFIAEGPIKSDIVIKLKDENAGEIIPMIETPDDNIRGICTVPGGFYAAFSEAKPKTVMFSDIAIPYSWPEQYHYDVRDNVVALSVMRNTVIVLTDGFPYSITGTAPEAMTISKLAGPAACVSRASVCSYNGKVYYASNTGLYYITTNYYIGLVAKNLTEGVFTTDQWEALNPRSCVMCASCNNLYASFDLPSGESKCFCIGLNDGSSAVTTHDEPTKCMCVDVTEDEVYFVRE